MGNPNSALTSEFQSILYYKFTFKREYDKNELAIFLNKSPDTVQRYVSGRLPVSADTARDIIRFASKKNPADTELLQFFHPKGFIPVPAAQAALSDEQREKKMLELTILLGKAIETIEAAEEDGKVEKPEYKGIHQLLTKMRQCIVGLDQAIAREVR